MDSSNDPAVQLYSDRGYGIARIQGPGLLASLALGGSGWSSISGAMRYSWPISLNLTSKLGFSWGRQGLVRPSEVLHHKDPYHHQHHQQLKHNQDQGQGQQQREQGQEGHHQKQQQPCEKGQQQGQQWGQEAVVWEPFSGSNGREGTSTALGKPPPPPPLRASSCKIRTAQWRRMQRSRKFIMFKQLQPRIQPQQQLQPPSWAPLRSLRTISETQMQEMVLTHGSLAVSAKSEGGGDGSESPPHAVAAAAGMALVADLKQLEPSHPLQRKSTGGPGSWNPDGEPGQWD